MKHPPESAPAPTTGVLEQCTFLQTLDPSLVERSRRYLRIIDAPSGQVVLNEGEHSHGMYIVLAGQALVRRKDMEITTLGPGSHFGELGLLTGRPRAASVVADGPLRLAALTPDAFAEMGREDPALALALMRQLVASLQQALVAMDDNVHALLADRAMPRRTTVVVRVGDEERRVRVGTRAGDVLPAEDGGGLTVAALLDRKAVSLNTTLVSNARVEPLTTGSWEGNRIFRWSVGLLLLEAARHLKPPAEIRIGPSVGFAQLVEVGPDEHRSLPDLAQQLESVVSRIITANVPFVTERVSVEEAVDRLEQQGWTDAVESLATWRDSTVPMVCLGSTVAVCTGPVLPSTGLVGSMRLVIRDGGLLMLWGERAASAASSPNGADTDAGMHAIRAAERAGRMTRQWLGALGVTTVGAFNARCTTREVSQILRVSESFHEKAITQIADDIATRGGRVRVITIAGPSASGKTTFIKRLTVQLQVNGINPVAVSLDDYYVDREATVRDAEGNYDFESVDALDLPLLHRHLQALGRGERVRLARFDFPRGKSVPDGGREVQLSEGTVLMLEGIHGLNPRVIGGGFDPDQTYRVFINAMSALPFDRLTHFSVSDLRLLRRIVRDRHHRATDAAETISRWPSVRRGEQRNIFPFLPEADAVFDSALIYEPSVLKVFADLYLLEVPRDHPSYATAYRLRHLVDRFVTIYPDQVPPTSILREFIGGSGFEY